MNTELKERLTALAYAKTHPFCYGCYIRAPKGKCPKCGSDDLMRELPGVGVEYGTEWVIESLISAELTPVDVEEYLEQSIVDCDENGGTVTILGMQYDAVRIIKELDPVTWRCMLADEYSHLQDDDQAVSFDNGSTLYWVSDVETYLDENEEAAS